GAAYVSQQYARALAPAHDVFIYARGGARPGATEAEWHGPNVHWAALPVVDADTAVDLDDFAAWLRARRLDWVVFNEQWWMEPLRTCAALGVKTAAYLVEYKTDQLPLYDAYDLLVANTRQQFETFEGRHPGVRHVPWGTDVRYFRPDTLDAAQPGCVTFVHSAGLNASRKGSDLVIAAFDQLWQSGERRARLIIQSQGAIRATLGEARVAALEQAGALTYRGPDARDPAARAPMAERRGLYVQGDVYLYPCRFDGVGLSVPEAAACGLYAITTDFPPMNEFVGPGNGEAIAITRSYATPRAHHPFAEPSLEALVAAMRRCAAEFTPAWKARARAYAEAHLDWDVNAAGLAALFGDASYQAPAAKARALDAIRRYETARLTSLRNRLAYAAPGVVRGLRGLARVLRVGGPRA
ncbi:MAG: glycosyltransferase, partial [Gemmatimonadetes bacterium]|nr:glycosyltransferase [Gemmatimonadota bacterium]